MSEMFSLASYLRELGVWHVRLRTLLRLDRPDWLALVVEPWFTEIAPVKAEEYGVECWQRLGARALVVDTNACYYRWRRLRELGRGLDDPATMNALRDGFGYAVMLGIVSGDDPTWLTLADIVGDDPAALNERLIEEVWECGRMSEATQTALSMAWSMFTMV